MDTKHGDLKVYLTGRNGRDFDRLKALVESAGATVETWEHSSGGGFGNQIWERIRTSDAVAVLVDDHTLPTAVLLELGAALGQSVAVVLVATDPSFLRSTSSSIGELPSVLLGKRTNPAITHRLGELLRASRVSSIQARTIEPDRTYVDEVSSRPWADESERRVAEKLAALGARVMGQLPANTLGRADLGIWVSALSPDINPVLVEITGRRANLKARENQLRSYLKAHAAFLGLLVYQGVGGPDWQVEGGTAIASVGVDTLSGLSPDSFSRMLLSGRNLLAHS